MHFWAFAWNVLSATSIRSTSGRRTTSTGSRRFFEPIRYATGSEGAKLAREIRDDLEKKMPEKDGKKQPVNGGEIRNEIQRRVSRGEVVPFDELQFVGLTNRSRGNSDKGKNTKGSSRVPTASVLGGDTLELTEFSDPRAPIMAWMRDPGESVLRAGVS